MKYKGERHTSKRRRKDPGERDAVVRVDVGQTRVIVRLSRMSMEIPKTQPIDQSVAVFSPEEV